MKFTTVPKDALSIDEDSVFVPRNLSQAQWPIQLTAPEASKTHNVLQHLASIRLDPLRRIVTCRSRRGLKRQTRKCSGAGNIEDAFHPECFPKQSDGVQRTHKRQQEARHTRKSTTEVAEQEKTAG